MLCLFNNINNIRKILINIERNMRRISSLIINSSNFAARQKSINFELQKEKKDEQKSSAEAAAGEQIVLHNEAWDWDWLICLNGAAAAGAAVGGGAAASL